MDLKARKNLKNLAKISNEHEFANLASIETDDHILGLVFLLSIFQLAKLLDVEIIDGHPYKPNDSYTFLENELSKRFEVPYKCYRRYLKVLRKEDNYELFQKYASFLDSNDIDYEPNLISWFYQYLKEEKKNVANKNAYKSGIKLSGDNLKYVTQFFTDHYMVEYLVKKCLSHSFIGNRDIQEIVIFDPACGGGNFLVESLRHLYKRYRKYYNNPCSLVRSIINNSITGYDFDYRLSNISKINIFLEAVNLSKEIPDAKISCYSGKSGDEIGFLDKKIDARRTYKIKNNKRLFLLTNPPFLGRRLMGTQLKRYLEIEYPLSKNDLCAAFLLKCLNLLNNGDIVGLVNQSSWMFLKSYHDLRKYILSNFNILECVDLGANAFADLSGEKARVALSIFNKPKKKQKSKFFRLTEFKRKDKVQKLQNKIYENEILYDVETDVFLKSNNSALLYTISQSAKIKSLLNGSHLYKEFALPMQGTSTGNNKEFIKYSWQVDKIEKDWIPVSKGGSYCKWLGLNRYLVYWGKNAEHIKSNKGSAVRNLYEIKNTDIVYSDTGTLGLNTRRLRKGYVFIASGPGIKVLNGNCYSHLAYLNSRIATYFIRLINPKLTISAGYIGMLPFPESCNNNTELIRLAKKCIDLKYKYLSNKLANDELEFNSIFESHNIDELIAKSIITDIELETDRLLTESQIERQLQTIFQLDNSDIKIVERDVGKCSGDLPIENPNINLENISKNFIKYIDGSCQYKTGNRTVEKVGIEGPVEKLSYSYRISPVMIQEVINDNIDKLNLIKHYYFEDIIHKYVLYILGFNSDRSWKDNKKSIKSVINYIFDILKISEEKFIQLNKDNLNVYSWVSIKLPILHKSVFKNDPIIFVEGEKIYLSRSK